jgi:hypothetical protein
MFRGSVNRKPEYWIGVSVTVSEIVLVVPGSIGGSTVKIARQRGDQTLSHRVGPNRSSDSLQNPTVSRFVVEFVIVTGTTI